MEDPALDGLPEWKQMQIRAILNEPDRVIEPVAPIPEENVAARVVRDEIMERWPRTDGEKAMVMGYDIVKAIKRAGWRIT